MVEKHRVIQRNKDGEIIYDSKIVDEMIQKAGAAVEIIKVKKIVNQGGRPKGTTKRTINRYKKVFHRFEILKNKYSSKTKEELYELLATRDYDGKTYSRKTIRNIIEDKKYNLIPSR